MNAFPDQTPLVSVGVPVRNGEDMLEAALRSIVSQSYRNLKINISDNGSTDRTPELCRAFARRDPRIRYLRQEEPISAIENFEFVLRQSHGAYFLWGAHDDLRSENFVEVLLRKLRANTDAVLAFGDLYVGGTGDAWRPFGPFDFDNTGLDLLGRLRKTAWRQCFHIYGLWRPDALRKMKFYRTYFWPDMPVLMAASTLGTFVYTPGVRFFYHEVPKDNRERMRTEYHTSGKRLLILRVTAATLANVAAVGHPWAALPAAWYVFSARFFAWMNIEVKGVLYRRSPEFVRAAWRRVKRLAKRR